MRLFMLFTDFDYSIFGRDRFILPDGRIFGGENHDTLYVTRLEEIDSNNVSSVLTYWTLCVSFDVDDNKWTYARNNF